MAAGFPPIREFRENFEDFFQSEKSGENRGFSAKIRELFFKTILNLLMREKTFLSGEVLLLESVSVVKWCFCRHYPMASGGHIQKE